MVISSIEIAFDAMKTNNNDYININYLKNLFCFIYDSLEEQSLLEHYFLDISINLDSIRRYFLCTDYFSFDWLSGNLYLNEKGKLRFNNYKLNKRLCTYINEYNKSKNKRNI